MPSPPAISVGLPWYTADDYPVVREKMADGEDMPDTFEQWQKVQMSAEQAMMEKGTRAHRIYLRPGEFFPWCAREKRIPDRDARLAYATLIAKGKVRDGIAAQATPNEPSES